MKRIFVVAPRGRAGPGGMCRMVDGMMREWRAAGRLPALALVDSTGPRRALMPLTFAASLLRVLAAGLAGRVALLHVHCAERGSVLRKGAFVLLGRALRVPVVLHMHGAEFAGFHDGLPRPGRWAVRRMLRLADRVVVLGTGWETWFNARLGLPGGHVCVAPNGVSLPRRAARRQGTCRLLFAGVLGERKGLADLLAALADPQMRGRQWSLDVAGDGDAVPFQAMAIAGGIAARVRFHGLLNPEAMRRLMRGADILVLPSRNEGLPMAVLEAMAHGAAVIATQVGCVADAVRHEVTGLLVPPGDVAALAGALSRLVAQPALRRDMGLAGRAAIASGFTVARQNEILQALFLNLLAAAP